MRQVGGNFQEKSFVETSVYQGAAEKQDQQGIATAIDMDMEIDR